jgi:hypothetical protein
MGWHVAVREMGEGHKEFWWGDVKEDKLLEALDLDGKLILKLTFQNYNWRITRLMWFSRLTGVRLL